MLAKCRGDLYYFENESSFDVLGVLDLSKGCRILGKGVVIFVSIETTIARCLTLLEKPDCAVKWPPYASKYPACACFGITTPGRCLYLICVDTDNTLPAEAL